MPGLSHSQRDQDSLCDGPGHIVKSFIKQLVIRVCVDEARFHQHGGHLGSVQNHQIGAFVDTLIEKSHCLKLLVDVIGHAGRLSIAVVHQGLHPAVLVGAGTGIAVNGDKVVGPGLIALLGFLRRGFFSLETICAIFLLLLFWYFL